jgi:uncharacterized protein with von Willebrand factor type A (vWA) domain
MTHRMLSVNKEKSQHESKTGGNKLNNKSNNNSQSKLCNKSGSSKLAKKSDTNNLKYWSKNIEKFTFKNFKLQIPVMKSKSGQNIQIFERRDKKYSFEINI